MENQSLFKEYKGVFAETEEKTETKKAEKFFAYSPFALQDAIGERSAKKSWIEYIKLRNEGIEAEDLVHKITSKARDMIFITKGATKEDLNMKDFPFNKSKKDAKNWQEKDLMIFYTKIIEAYHNARLGKGELAIALEKILLSI